MRKSNWFLSTWFIAIMFALWFLIFPLVIGIVLLIRLNKENKDIYHEIDGKEKALNDWKNALNKRELEIEQLIQRKHKEASLIDLAQTIRTVSKIREKEEELLLQEESLNKKSQKLLLYHNKKKQEIEAANSRMQAKEKELFYQKNALIEQEKKVKELVVQKQKELSLIDLTQQIRIISKIREKEVKNREQELEDIKQQISILEKKKINLEDEVLLQSFGFYDNRFFLENSKEYLEYLNIIRGKQKQLVREKRATEYDIISLQEGNVVQGSAQSKLQIKLAIRSFNSECDAAISKVKFNNVEVAEKKIRSSFYDINRLNKYNSFSITEEYLKLKLEELFLVHEYAEKKQEEREEQRRINELIREEKRAQKELEEELNKIKKEEQHLLNVISKLSLQISEQEMLQYQNRLEEIREQKEQVDYRVKNTKAGYVYVISNIGCFGENVYKVGMTRRLEPMDRVRELGGASVPFHFDVHAMIFSEDAPALEASLHRAFHHRRVNRINERKEFFRVTLSEIKKVVHQNHNARIEFTMAAEAKEYRETQMLEKKLAKQNIV